MTTTGSDICDAFLAAVARDLAVGAAEHVQRLAEREELTTAADATETDDARCSHLLAERAAFHWAHRVLESAGEHATAQGLLSLRGGQAGYTGKMLIDVYEPILRPRWLDGARCLNEAGHAMLTVASFATTPSKDEANAVATRAGHSLEACFRQGAVTSVVDEALDALTAVLPKPKANPTTVAD